MIKTELYFGLSRYPAPDITNEQFDGFVDTYITPRFPGGFTVINGVGQWDAKGGTISEPCKIVVIIHANNTGQSDNIGLIRNQYCKIYDQESVLRIDYEVNAIF